MLGQIHHRIENSIEIQGKKTHAIQDKPQRFPLKANLENSIFLSVFFGSCKNFKTKRLLLAQSIF